MLLYSIVPCSISIRSLTSGSCRTLIEVAVKEAMLLAPLLLLLDGKICSRLRTGTVTLLLLLPLLLALLLLLLLLAVTPLGVTLADTLLPLAATLLAALAAAAFTAAV
jgi:hypothetical protein